MHSMSTYHFIVEVVHVQERVGDVSQCHISAKLIGSIGQLFFHGPCHTAFSDLVLKKQYKSQLNKILDFLKMCYSLKLQVYMKTSWMQKYTSYHYPPRQLHTINWLWGVFLTSRVPFILLPLVLNIDFYILHYITNIIVFTKNCSFITWLFFFYAK